MANETPLVMNLSAVWRASHPDIIRGSMRDREGKQERPHSSSVMKSDNGKDVQVGLELQLFGSRLGTRLSADQV